MNTAQQRHPHQRRTPNSRSNGRPRKKSSPPTSSALSSSLRRDTPMRSPPTSNAMSRFHNYSFGNILEIARQRPTATRVAGLYAWNQLGRRVKKGEKGIRILAPIVGIKRKKDEEAEKDITKQNTRVLVGFRNAYVFDVEQTDGAELPDMREIQRRRGREPRPSCFVHRGARHRACLYREHRPRAGHELRRTHCHPARTVEGRGVLHACS